VQTYRGNINFGLCFDLIVINNSDGLFVPNIKLLLSNILAWNVSNQKDVLIESIIEFALVYTCSYR